MYQFYSTLIIYTNSLIIKKSKLTVVVIMLCIMAFVGYKNHGSSQLGLIIGNIEAIAGPETGAINMEFYFENGASGSLSKKPECAKGTTVSAGTPDIPMGDIYPCQNEIMGGLLTKIGYCYKSK